MTTCPKQPTKAHLFVDVGFAHPKFVCKHCNAEESAPQPKPGPIMLLPPKGVSFTRIPLLRGFTEIAALYDLARQYDAVIAGGYAAYCCSPWDIGTPNIDRVLPGHCHRTPNIENPRDIDVFPSSNELATKLVAALLEFGFTMKHETQYSHTLSAPVLQETVSPAVMRWVVPHDVQVIKTGRIGDGWIGVNQPEGWNDLGHQVLSTFDITVARAAIISEREALVDSRFWDHQGRRHMEIEGFRAPARLFGRIAKYLRKGYAFDREQVLNKWRQALEKYAEAEKNPLFMKAAESILATISGSSKPKWIHNKLAASGIQAHEEEAEEFAASQDSGA